MLNPDGDHLVHVRVANGDFYDPVKAHEYYLRTRELKGRAPAVVKPLVGRSKNAVVSKNPPIKDSPLKVALKLRVADLQIRLDKLKTLLDELVKAADAKRSPAKTKSSIVTSADRAKTAKSSANYYDRNKTKIAAKAKIANKINQNPFAGKTLKELDDQIANVRSKISEIRSSLAFAMKQ